MSRRRPQAQWLCAPIISVLIEILTFHWDDPSRITSLGLISATPWVLYPLALMLSLSFALALRSRSPSAFALVAHFAALALLLPGLPGFLEQYPRFGTAWLHTGFVRAIIIHGKPIVGLDARFSWPGFFTAIAAVVGMAHLGSALSMLRWAPMVQNLAYALPVFITARAMLRSDRKAWVVAWLFLLTNWVGQDYFSPQGLAYFIFLGVLAIVISSLRRRGGRPLGGRRLAGLITRFGSTVPLDTEEPTVAIQCAMLVIAMLAVIALSMEHQLTPVALGIDLVVLALTRQTRANYFTVAVLISVVAWIAYGAFTFWQGHLYSTLFGSGGASAVQATVTSRIGGSVGHEIVVYERLLFAAGVWLLAAAATLRGLRRRAPVPLAALALALGPFVMLAVQSYGGEAGLRVYLYTLPSMLIIAVAGFADGFPRRSLRTVTALTLASTLLVPFLLIARFGNEKFEQITSGDVAAARYVYSVAPPGSAIGSVSLNALVGYQGLASYAYPPHDEPGDFAFTTPQQILRGLGHNRRGVYLLITPAQVEYAVINDGLPADWAEKLEAKLATNSNFKLLFNRFGGRVYKVSIKP